MPLNLTLKPNEVVLINGCVVRNSDRRQTIMIESKGDIVRQRDLLNDSEARTPVKEVYFFIQTALLDTDVREKLVLIIQKKLGQLVPVFHDEMSQHIFEAASHVSHEDFYKAMRALRPLMDYEAQLFDMLNNRQVVTAAE